MDLLWNLISAIISALTGGAFANFIADKKEKRIRRGKILNIARKWKTTINIADKKTQKGALKKEDYLDMLYAVRSYQDFFACKNKRENIIKCFRVLVGKEDKDKSIDFPLFMDLDNPVGIHSEFRRIDNFIEQLP